MSGREHLRDSVRDTLSEGWKKHFASRHRTLREEGYARSLDHSNERCQLQICAHLIEAVGPLSGKALLDAGCGWGMTSLIFEACGARVMGVDIVPDTIAALQQGHPRVRWEAVDLTRNEAVQELPMFDVIVAAEVLQYLGASTAVARLWTRVNPGGRLVGCIPNADCQIVKRVVEREVLQWQPESVAGILRWGRSLPDVNDVKIKPLDFQSDQTFLPYAAGPWGADVQSTANRLVFVLLRK